MRIGHRFAIVHSMRATKSVKLEMGLENEHCTGACTRISTTLRRGMAHAHFSSSLLIFMRSKSNGGKGFSHPGLGHRISARQTHSLSGMRTSSASSAYT
jgi:hypothetical protein